jgi:hypothetical protein
VSHAGPAPSASARFQKSKTPKKGTNTIAQPDNESKRSQSVSLPEWLSEHVFMNSLLPFVIDMIGIDTNIWDLDADGKLLSIAQDALDEVIALEDLGVEGCRLSAGDRFYQHVCLCLDDMHMLL